MGSGGGVFAMTAYMGDTRGSSVLSSAGGVIEMSVVRGVGGVYDMCMCLARGGVGGLGGEWVRGLGLGFTNPGGTRRKWDMGLCFGCGGVGGVGGSGWAAWLGYGGFAGVMSECVVSLNSCVYGRSRCLYIVLGGYLRILGAPIVQSCCTLPISAS